jgi:hypothetical protein
MTLVRTREAFDHSDFVFELKYDGFRALAYVDAGSCRLVSRKNLYKAYAPLCEWIGKHLRADSAVLDGELACLDEEGKPQFNRLLRRRGEPVFVAFDLLWLNGRAISATGTEGGGPHAPADRGRTQLAGLRHPPRDGVALPVRGGGAAGGMKKRKPKKKAEPDASFRAKVAELKGKLEKMPADRQEQLRRELRREQR